ncbi:MAG: DUF2914 domain-containing protein [Candidatus Latescibacterota bacterium]|nr:MAG: DUF2914 domain-containing protein [Candidatus Latescibacterota bacterium]
MLKPISVVALLVTLSLSATVGLAQTDTLSIDQSQTEGTAVSATRAKQITRAVFTNGIESREPIDRVDSLTTQVNNIFFFCEVRDMEGQTVTHRWIHDEKKMAEVSFEIGGPRWRVYSSKTLLPEWTGRWKVEIVDGEGNKLDERSFVYEKAE